MNQNQVKNVRLLARGVTYFTTWRASNALARLVEPESPADRLSVFGACVLVTSTVGDILAEHVDKRVDQLIERLEVKDG